VRGQRRENGQCSPQARSGNAKQTEVRNFEISFPRGTPSRRAASFFWLCIPLDKLEALTDAEDKNHLHARPGYGKNRNDPAADRARSRRLSDKHESRAAGMGAWDCSADL